MNKRYQLIIQSPEKCDKFSEENISILLVDNQNYLTIMEANSPKEFQHDIEEMARLKYGDQLNIIRQHNHIIDHHR